VGFEGAKREQSWWTLDRFFTFSSPVVHSDGGRFGSFFTGVKTDVDASQELKRQLVDPHATFVRGGRRFYVGLYASAGSAEEKYYQTIYICDDAGNPLYADTLLKQVNTDVVLGEDVEEKMLYTAKQTSRFVAQPAVSPGGNIFYSISDYEANTITVRKRTYAEYRPAPCAPALAHYIDFERDCAYEPVNISCADAARGGRTIPSVTITDETGKRRTATARDLFRHEFIVRIFRRQYSYIDRRLSSRRVGVPDEVHAIRDSLSRSELSGCPFALSLSGPRGVVRSFDYGPRERVLCARVLALTKDGTAVVRVDLDTFAEILLFTAQGDFVNRFAFNRQPWRDRRDIVVCEETGPIVELDYEAERKSGAFFEWQSAMAAD
jgi:hypothetical protein